MRGERAAGPIRAGATVGWQRVSLRRLDDDLTTVGADVAFDTRLDPVLPRNAVFASAAWERVDFEAGDGIHRTRLDARGYLGVYPAERRRRCASLREDANRPLPPYLKSLLGGWSSLRGFKAGSFVGDTMVAGSIELRIPLTTPLSVGKLGISLFADTGKAYAQRRAIQRSDAPHRHRRQRLVHGRRVPHGALGRARAGADTRVNFGGGIDVLEWRVADEFRSCRSRSRAAFRDRRHGGAPSLRRLRLHTCVASASHSSSDDPH